MSLDVEGMGLFDAVPVHVLIVEVDENFRRNLSERLHLEGTVVFEASDESAAKDMAKNRNIDVVLLGVNGVSQNGLPLLRFIKETRPSVEVILMTPLQEHSLFISIQAMKLGAFDDLLIPFDIKTLIDRILAASRQKKRKEGVKWKGSR